MEETAASVETQVTDTRIAEPSGSFAVPEAYAQKGWAQNIKSQDDLWKEVDTLYPLVGKKSIPTADSTDEEWSEFYNKLRPESADNYEFALPEGFDNESLNQEELGKYKQLFHDVGLTPKQAQALFDGDLKIRGEGAMQSQEERDAEFKTMATEVFGDKVGDAIKVSNTMLRGLPAEQAEAIQELPNNQLVAVMTLLNQVQKKYSVEDAPVSSEPAPSMSKEQVSKELLETKNKLRDTDMFSPDYKALEEKVRKLREQHQRLYNS